MNYAAATGSAPPERRSTGATRPDFRPQGRMLAMSDISVRIAGRLLIDHSSVQITPGARVGFVGRNGVGKSTLFQAIRGDLPTETGMIIVPPRWTIGSLAQEAPNGPEKLIEVVLKAD